MIRAPVLRSGRFSAVLAGIALAGLLSASPALASPSPVITDYAGDGTPGPPTPGPATSSQLRFPMGVAVDGAGNLYIADNKNAYVEKVTPDGTLSIVAGDGTFGTPTPGPATSSALGPQLAVAVDGADNLYIADDSNRVVEKVTPDGTLSIFAGDETDGAPTPGPATSSSLGAVRGVGVDSAGNLYMADASNAMVEKVTPDGTLSVIAGNGTSGAPTPGPATSSALGSPQGVAVDGAGNLYIADGGNDLVEMVTPDGTLSVFAGDGTSGAPTPGPATSSALGPQLGVAVDSAGSLYIADAFNNVVETVTPGGTLSIFAGDGTIGAPTYGGPATSSDLNHPFAVALNTEGTAFIADTLNHTVDRVGFATPGAPGQPVLSPGDGSAQMSFTPPTDMGTSAITGYQVSLDGGVTWRAITTSPGAGGTLTARLTGLDNGTTYGVTVRAVNSSGPGADSPSGSVTPQGPPINLKPPAVSGRTAVGQTLRCLLGSWSGGVSRFAIQWNLEGAPIRSATSAIYLVPSADQGHTLTCTVTASNSAGSAQSTSAAVMIPIVNVSLCPRPTGGLAGTRLGPVWLGLSRSRARRMLPRFQIRSSHTDNFCLAGGWGIRAGYATRRLRGKLPGDPHASGIILLLTANPYYRLHGVTPGMRVAAAASRLKIGKVIHLGRNWWYVIPGNHSNWVLKTRHGVIQEIGLASKQLTATGLEQVRLLAHF